MPEVPERDKWIQPGAKCWLTGYSTIRTDNTFEGVIDGRPFQSRTGRWMVHLVDLDWRFAQIHHRTTEYAECARLLPRDVAKVPGDTDVKK